MQISIEQLIIRVIREVIQELKNQNITITFSTDPVKENTLDLRTKTETLDMSKYKTPIVTENHIQRLHELTGEILVPAGTIITPKAKELIREKQIQVTIK